MIPKTIHYCWFGKKEYPELFKICYESWKRYCPDYEIVEWNEENVDIKENCYIEEAYKNQKWAFVSDYVRLKVLYEFGGIYLDTDVELIKTLDPYLRYRSFWGIENNEKISTGTIGAEKKNPLIQQIMGYYKNKHFILEDGTVDCTTNVDIITGLLKETYKIYINNNIIKSADGLFVLFPSDYFCPKDNITGKIHKTDNTCAIHHFDGSWLDEAMSYRIELQQKFSRVVGKTMALILAALAAHIKYDGIKETVHFLYCKFYKKQNK